MIIDSLKIFTESTKSYFLNAMSKKSFKNKHQQQWEWEETPETKAAIAALHEGIRKRQLKEEDDKLNYETGGK